MLFFSLSLTFPFLFQSVSRPAKLESDQGVRFLHHNLGRLVDGDMVHFRDDNHFGIRDVLGQKLGIGPLNEGIPIPDNYESWLLDLAQAVANVEMKHKIINAR